MNAVSIFLSRNFFIFRAQLYIIEPSRIAIDRMDLEKRKSKWCVEEAERVKKGIKSPR